MDRTHDLLHRSRRRHISPAACCADRLPHEVVVGRLFNLLASVFADASTVNDLTKPKIDFFLAGVPEIYYRLFDHG